MRLAIIRICAVLAIFRHYVILHSEQIDNTKFFSKKTMPDRDEHLEWQNIDSHYKMFSIHLNSISDTMLNLIHWDIDDE